MSYVNNIYWKFEHTRLKKKSQNFDIGAPEDPKKAPKPHFFNRYETRAMRSTYAENLNALAWKTKFQKFWQIGARAPKGDPETKIFQSIWYHRLLTYIL